MVIVKNASPEHEQGSFIGGVFTASGLAIGYTYTRGAQYWYEGRVLLAVRPA